MIVRELEKLVPKSKVYELKSNCKYLILVNRVEVSREVSRELMNHLEKENINAALLELYHPDSAVKIFQLDEK